MHFKVESIILPVYFWRYRVNLTRLIIDCLTEMKNLWENWRSFVAIYWKWNETKIEAKKSSLPIKNQLASITLIKNREKRTCYHYLTIKGESQWCWVQVEVQVQEIYRLWHDISSYNIWPSVGDRFIKFWEKEREKKRKTQIETIVIGKF